MRPRLTSVIPVAVVVAVVIAFFAFRNDEPRKPITISASEPEFATLSELVHASDAIVIARASETREGRIVGSDTDPNTVIRTRLVTLEVGDVLRGSAVGVLMLEEAFELGDGTPITVNDVNPTMVGDEGVFFLESASTDQPNTYGLINAQSRYLVTGPDRSRLEPGSDDQLSLELAQLGPFTLRCEILKLDPDSQSAVC